MVILQVMDKNVLPFYPYRDDATAVYEAIKRYVSAMVAHFYGSWTSCSIRLFPNWGQTNAYRCTITFFETDCPEKIENDHELQNWGAELVKSKKRSGCGIKVEEHTSLLRTVERQTAVCPDFDYE